MREREVDEAARLFWFESRYRSDVFPRPIEQAVCLALPVTVVRLEAVNGDLVGRWLSLYGIPARVPESRQLMGCLVAYRGKGVIFVHGGDSAVEQRLTIAHEAAHFLLDYLLPRRQVVAAMGPGAEAVLDGDRLATIQERTTAILAHVRLGSHVHLLPRPGQEEGLGVVGQAESRADELATELLAPVDQREVYLRRAVGMSAEGCAALAEEMGEAFGVPAYVFARGIRAAAMVRPRSFLDEAIAAMRESRS